MQIYYNQLEKHLVEDLKSIYLISGNEVYQEDFCVENIVNKAKEHNFLEHEIIYVEKTFDWNNFQMHSTNLSLFSEKKIIELRFLTKTINSNAENKIKECIDNYDDQTILIIRMPQLKSSDYKKKYLSIKNNNVGFIRLYAMTKKNILEELAKSVKKFNYKINNNCLDFIADLYEGNMVAANQALLKIDLMASDSTVIDLNFLKKVFSKDVDFEASNLVDYSIEGNIIKIQTCINFLKQNDYPAQYVIWSFIRSFRTILFNLDSINNGKPIDEILRTIWPYERKNLMSNSLKKLSALKIEAYLGVLVRLDMQSKNVIDGNTWDSIYDLSVSVAKNKLSVIKYT